MIEKKDVIDAIKKSGAGPARIADLVDWVKSLDHYNREVNGQNDELEKENQVLREAVQERATKAGRPFQSLNDIRVVVTETGTQEAWDKM